MKRIITLPIAVACCAAFTLTGCGTALDVATGPGPSPQQQRHEDNRTYLQFVHEEIPVSSQLSDREIVSMGRMVCQRLDNGDDLTTMALDAANAGTTAMAATVIGGAIGIYCPEYKGEVRKMAGDWA